MIQHSGGDEDGLGEQPPQKRQRTLTDIKTPSIQCLLENRLDFFRTSWEETVGPIWEEFCLRGCSNSTGVVIEHCLILFMAWSRKNRLFNPLLNKGLRLQVLGFALTTAVCFNIDDEAAHIIYNLLWRRKIVDTRSSEEKPMHQTPCEASILAFLRENDFTINEPYYMNGINYTPQYMVYKHIGQPRYVEFTRTKNFNRGLLDIVIRA